MPKSWPATTLIAILILCPHLVEAGAGLADVADSDPGLFIVMMLMLAGFLGACAAALCIILLIFGISCTLVLGGILSVSIITAWYQRSITKDLFLFLLLLFGVIGATGGSIAGYIIGYVYDASVSGMVTGSMGAIVGFISGMLCTPIFIYVAKVLYRPVGKSLWQRRLRYYRNDSIAHSCKMLLLHS